ncbi:MAG: 4-hydroxy-3-methylbut-2-enyl diphosphate reductase [Lentimicrobium sp.]
MNNLRPRIEIDPSAGFCSGVKRAIESAENLLKSAGEVSCLGEIVHNEAEMDRLKGLGMRVIGPDDSEIPGPGGKVLIRAHGVPPETYKELKDKQAIVTDATCPVVLRLQQKVKQASAEMMAVGGTVVIFGKPKHAEVVGLIGNTSGNALVVSTPEQLNALDFTKPIRVFSQTTSDLNRYREIGETILSLAWEAGNGESDIVIHHTVCGQVSRRAPAIEKFAGSHDVIIFVSGIDSSNGKYLAGISKSVNDQTHIVSGPGQLNPAWFGNASSIGISGATSTPQWLMQQIATEIGSMI